MQIANFDKRLFAYIIDYLICLFLGIGLYILIYINISKPVYFKWFYFIPLFTSLFYILICGIFTLITNGLTLGNILFRIKMVSIRYQKLSIRQIFVKYVPLSILPCVLVNGIYMLLKHTEKTIFDELSHTISISL